MKIMIESKLLETKNNILNKKKGNHHFSAAIKEWKSSSYNFNKGYQRNIASRDNITNKLIKSYFYFSNLKFKPRSLRMRSLRRKITSKKIFTSKPEIKQTNDKVIITLFTYNREKQFLLKKLYYYNRRRRILDLWRKNKSFKLRLVSKDKAKLLTTHKITEAFIRQNENIYAQFVSKLIPKKDKILLYNKIYNKVTRKSNKKFGYIINWLKKKIYKSGRERFKKREATITQTRFTRKKMKDIDHKSPELEIVQGHKQVPYSGMKLKNEMNFLSHRILLGNKRLAYARKLFYFNFLKYILSMFNLKVYAFKSSPNISTVEKVANSDELVDLEEIIKREKKGKRIKKNRFMYNVDKNIRSIFDFPYTTIPKGNIIKLYFYKINKNLKSINKIKVEKTNKSTGNILSLSKPLVINIKLLESENKLVNSDNILSNINYIISQLLNNMLTKSKLKNKERKLYVLHKNYYKDYYRNFIRYLAKKQRLLSVHYSRFMINKFKFSNWLPNLKLAMSKIYNKKIELNIINLKYPHLHTDIYSKIVSLKLRDRLSPLNVMKKALTIAKRPSGFKLISNMEIDYDLNKTSDLAEYKSLKLKTTNLSELLNKIYPRSMVNNSSYVTKKVESWKESKVITSKMKNVLKIIKYKTITGVRLEAAGRLTKRYTATRSVYKYRYKGSLRNIDYSRINKNQSTVMLRNQVTPNIQYGLTHGKRRVGSFGVKGWISGY